ncbi:DUF4007 family protein [Mesorhizobium sp. BAC0120]|uniref:DUF4007 family protein n=1 Tax=Mesorhizobium sp. BAC0120 TaxID=3090670 RepID=UPI00298D5901|nr:DUF4007 family protein [Mesorhizobium sp. BAC0120]MDW6023928.1 DUF4007 family protein [Mesorhizobium sp. BAC0120]
MIIVPPREQTDMSSRSSREQTADAFRFGGHQTFPLRIAWLPKVAKGLSEGRDVLGSVLDGVVTLGLGKNMVEALRCWADAYGVAFRDTTGWRLTDEGDAIFGPNGHDRYLEDVQTLWWLHWKISTQEPGRFFAWELLFNRWNDPTFTASAVLSAFAKEAERSGRSLSEVSLKQHFDVWLRTYCTPRGGRLGEDGLDCPLTSLGLIRPAGELEGLGRREPVYGFDLSPKRAISQALFRYCLMAWWEARSGNEDTIPFHQVVSEPGSPGRVFRMPESELRSRLEMLGRVDAEIRLVESLNQQQLRRIRNFPPIAHRLATIYSPEAVKRAAHA